MPQWNGQWPGGRTYLDRHGNTRWQLERMHNGVRYSRRLEARNETEAFAELALFDRDPDAYLTKSEAARKAADEAVFMDAELVARFLAHLKAEGRTERYRRNMRTYLGSEIGRIARGECELEVLNNHPEIRGVVRFIHKSGRVHTQSLDGQ